MNYNTFLSNALYYYIGDVVIITEGFFSFSRCGLEGDVQYPKSSTIPGRPSFFVLQLINFKR